MKFPARPLRLHRHPLSGHSHRVELFLSILGLPFELVEVNLAARQQKSPEFLRKNPFGQIPVLEDGDLVLADSNAILTYLALEYDGSNRWLPADPIAHAQIVRWFAVAAGPLVQGPGAARLHAVFGAPVDLQKAQATAQALLGVLESTLAARPFLVGELPTVADLALFTYTAHAPEGGIELSPYVHVRAWLERVRSIPRFVPMQETRTALYAP